ncbi:PREDICTED: chymotrypsin-2-like [Ceratosolen solmsi marchali]|uniref:trypsin n=1 Tax=Ceratosolen solmsi marchali TaxID=326594 RepID=A0AAJ6YWM9_9HYME|nr:PREDICTED: chymotrypsin-2-like [Ceratosolen solmsi marchali]
MRLQYFSAIFARHFRIIGGENAGLHEFPYFASFRWISSNIHFCGGAIVSQRYIVTAAHCVSDLHKKKRDVAIYVGVSNKNTSGTMLTIRNIHVDPEYSSITNVEQMNRHDFSIVKETIIFNEAQNKVELENQEIRENDLVLLSGWGSISYPNNDFADILQKTTMRILDNNKCSQRVGFVVHYEQVCAFKRKGIGACIGDSGSPLVINGKLVGISSFVLPCALGQPDNCLC